MTDSLMFAESRRYPGASVVERVTGIEPALSAWEADVLPLNYTRVAAVTPSAGRESSPSWPTYRTGEGRLRACSSLIVTSRPRSRRDG
jgi:hypothetical protein